MNRRAIAPRHPGRLSACLVSCLVLAGCSASARNAAPGATGLPEASATTAQVLRGRQLVISHDCAGCHGGMGGPAATGWLAGKSGEGDAEPVGPFRQWARNLTPDDETGLGRVSPRQIFNALRYGLRPDASPDITVSSAEPGQGGHPAEPDYLSPGMPWAYWRFLPDADLWAIAAYLKHGLRPVRHEVPRSEAPPDLWASESSTAKIGTHVLPPFPARHEELRDPARRVEVLRGRALVASTGCSACHGGAVNPDQDGWLTGARPGLHPIDHFKIGPFTTYPRNITPDNSTGIGRFSERQLFNSLRYGLRPGETGDVDITSAQAGQGNHPAHPKYLAPPMIWPSVRHLSDRELQDIVAYLKHGVRPQRNRVQDSEGPPDFWASAYAPEAIGGVPAPDFPTGNEQSLR